MPDVSVREAADGGVIVTVDTVSQRALRDLVKSRAPQAAVHLVGGRLELDALGAGALLDAQDLTLSWDPGTERAARMRQKAIDAHPAMKDLSERLRVSGFALARELLRDARGLQTLDDHQLIDVALMVDDAAFGACIFDEQGTGKTVVVIHAFDILVDRRLAERMIVVAPKSMVPEWQHDIHRFMGDVYRVSMVTGGRSAVIDPGADIIVCNYETAVAAEASLSALARSSPDRTVLVVDESYNIKNRNAKRTRALRRIRRWCSRAYVLCGTPAPNAPHDIVEQFNLVDFGLTFAGTVLPDDRNAAAPVAQKAMEARGIFTRNLKARVLPQLPEKRVSRVLVEFEPRQRELYEVALTGLIDDVQASDDRWFARHLATFMGRKMALAQICSHPAAVVPGYIEVPAKFLALDSILQEVVQERGEKVIVWSFFRRSLEELVERYSSYGVVRYDGTVESVTDRRDAVRRFQEDDETMIFVGNPAAAGAGLTLHRARVAVYESFSNQAAHFMQSVDRIHRRGQQRAVELVALLCHGSIDELEFDRLESKLAGQRALLADDDVGTVTRTSFLAELMAARKLLSDAS